MFITRSTGMSYASITSLIADEQRNPSISENRQTQAALLLLCFAFKSRFKRPPFFNKFRSFAKTIPLAIAIAMLQLTTHSACRIFFIICRTLPSNSNGRRLFVPRSFLGSSLSSSFSTLVSLIIPCTVDSRAPNFFGTCFTLWTIPHLAISAFSHNYQSVVFSPLSVVHLCFVTVLNLIFFNLFQSTSLCSFRNTMFNLLKILKSVMIISDRLLLECVLETQSRTIKEFLNLICNAIVSIFRVIPAL